MKTWVIIGIAGVVAFYVLFSAVVGWQSSKMAEVMHKPITDMNRGELLAWMLVIAWLFSSSDKEKK